MSLRPDWKDYLGLMLMCLSIAATVTLVALYVLGWLNGFPVAPSEAVWCNKKPSLQCENVSETELSSVQIVGMSMRPTLWPGDTIMMVEYNASRPLVEGDIVEVSNPRFMHRVCGVYPDFLWTVGDNNPRESGERVAYGNVSRVACAVTFANRV